MTREEMISMAREAGFKAGNIVLSNGDSLPFIAPISATDCMPELCRFADLVVAAEREACMDASRIALLGADRALTDRVMKAIKARGKA